MTALLPSLPLANQTLIIVGLSIGGLVALFVVMAMTYAALYRKVKKGTALIRTGFGGTKIEFNGILVWPVFHRVETMDISLKRIEIDRTGNNGLICQDNMRADIKVAFFVRVNNVEEDVLRVAQSVGCERASSEPEIRNLFDAKFSDGSSIGSLRSGWASLG